MIGKIRRKPLTIGQRERAVAVYKCSTSYPHAVRLLRRQKIYISGEGLRKLVNKVRKTKTVADRRRSGRPRMTAKQEDYSLIRLATRNRQDTLPELSEGLHTLGGPRVSRQTIGRRLKERGLSRRVALRRPLLTQEQRRKRFLWGRKYSKAGIQFWRRIAFSDEKIFEAGKGCPHVKVTRKQGEKYHPKCIQPIPKRGVKVHVWGLIRWDGVGSLRLVSGNLNAIKYQGEVIFDIDRMCRIDPTHPRRGLIFQQDKAPAHAARTTMNFLAQKGVSLLPWPGNSPDLNPIEHVWSYVARRVRARGLPSNNAQYFEWILQEWENTPVGYIKSLYRSMYSRVQEVLKNKGGSTRY